MKQIGTVVFLALILGCFKSQAQTDTITKSRFIALNEATLSLSYANGGIAFGVLYKRQVGRKLYFRMSLADIRFSGIDNSPIYSNQFPNQSVAFSADLSLGVEWRFKLHKLVTTYTGVDVLGGVSYYVQRIQNPALPSNQATDDQFHFSAGLAFSSGVRFNVHQLVKVGLNVSPDIIYSYQPWEYTDGSGNLYKGVRHSVGTSFSSSSVQLQIIFVWNRNHRISD